MGLYVVRALSNNDQRPLLRRRFNICFYNFQQPNGIPLNCPVFYVLLSLRMHPPVKRCLFDDFCLRVLPWWWMLHLTVDTACPWRPDFPFFSGVPVPVAGVARLLRGLPSSLLLTALISSSSTASKISTDLASLACSIRLITLERRACVRPRVGNSTEISYFGLWHQTRCISFFSAFIDGRVSCMFEHFH